MSKLQRTNERCYICDFSKQVGADGFTEGKEPYAEAIGSIYLDGLSKEFQGRGGRYVFLHPKDGKPICSDCNKHAEITLSDFTAGEEVTWHDTNSRLFDKSLSVPSDLYNPNIDWSKATPPYTFPLPTKQKLRHLGVQCCTKYQEHPTTEAEQARVDAIRAAKGYRLSIQQEETRRRAYNRAVEAFWSPTQSDPGLAGTSEWPMQTATGDPSEARTEHVQ